MLKRWRNISLTYAISMLIAVSLGVLFGLLVTLVFVILIGMPG